MSSDERLDEEVVKAEVVDFIDYYANDEYEVTFEIPPAKKKRVGICRAEKRVDFNEKLKTIKRHQFKVL